MENAWMGHVNHMESAWKTHGYQRKCDTLVNFLESNRHSMFSTFLKKVAPDSLMLFHELECF